MGEARKQAPDRNGDGGAPEDVADAVMGACAERENPLGMTVDVEA